jgi:hypothetical protein
MGFEVHFGTLYERPTGECRDERFNCLTAHMTARRQRKGQARYVACSSALRDHYRLGDRG